MEELTRLRAERGWSQQRLADESKVNKATINQIERGRRSPNVETLEKLADALGAGVGDFFPKAQAPLWSGDDGQERRNDVYGPWIDFLRAYVSRWEERVVSGSFDLGAYNEFIATVEDLGDALDRLNRREYQEVPLTDYLEGRRAKPMHDAITRLMDLFESLLGAATAKLGGSDLEQARARRARVQDRLQALRGSDVG